jgi:hypothetical protein
MWRSPWTSAPRAPVGVDAGAAKGAQYPVLQGAAGYPLTIGTDEQRRGRRPGG